MSDDFLKQLPSEPPAKPNPRAFAIGTGAVLQSVGVAMALSGCVLWGLSDWIIRPATGGSQRWIDFFATQSGAAAWTIGVLLGFLHGLACVAAGVGLQGEKPGSGRFAVAINGLAMLGYLSLCVWLMIAERRWLAALVPLLPAVWAGFLAVLSVNSASVLRRFPPPPDLNQATPEILEEHRRKRAERLKDLD